MQSTISVEKKDAGYAIVSICREPVNSMNLELWQELNESFSGLEQSPEIKGVIFQSGLKRDVFTAGNDINELYAPKTSAERYQKFWVTQNQFFARLYKSRLVTVAAIKGAAPAGGCALALCCDYRVMTDFGSIGLNEVALGIPVPEYWALLMQRTLGQRQAELILPYGRMLTPEEALKVGLVDQLVPSKDLMGAAEEAILKLLVPHTSAQQTTKLHLRKAFALQWEEFCVTEAAYGWQLISHPKTIEAIERVLQKLSKKQG